MCNERKYFVIQSMLKDDELFKEIGTSSPNPSVTDDSNVWGRVLGSTAHSGAAVIKTDCANLAAHLSLSQSVSTSYTLWVYFPLCKLV